MGTDSKRRPSLPGQRGVAKHEAGTPKKRSSTGNAIGTDEARLVPIPVNGTKCLKVDDREGDCYYLLKNSETYSYLKLDDRDLFLWGQFDGSTTLGDAAEAYCREFKTLGFRRIGDFYEKLVKNGFLEAASAAPTSPDDRGKTEPEGKAVQARIGRTMKKLAFHPVGPELRNRFFDSLDDLGFGFLGEAVLLWLISGLGLLGLAFFLHSLFVRGAEEAYRVLRPGGYYSLALLSLYVGSVIGSLVHGIHRAAALKAQGCEVIKAGLALRFGVLGAHVDIRDYQTAPRRKRVGIHLSGVAAEIFLLGICGALATMEIPRLYGELLVLGTLVLGVRLIFHLCPFFESEVYRGVSEAIGVPHLRRAAFRFLRPRYWVKLWGKEKWETQEVAFFFFGVWSVLWVCGAGKLASFLFRSELSEALIGLLQRIAAGDFAITPDEAAAVFMVLMLAVPLTLFLILSVIYVSGLLYRFLPRLEIWRRPFPLTAALAGASGVPGILVWLSYGAQSQWAVRGAAALGAVFLATVLFTTTRKQTLSPFSGGLSVAINLGVFGATAGVLAALGQSERNSVWSWPMALGAILSSLAFLAFAWPLLLSLASPFALPRLGTAAALGVGALAGALAFLESGLGVVTFEAPQARTWVSLVTGSAWLFLTLGWGNWFLARHRSLVVPRYVSPGDTSDLGLFVHGVNYLMTTLLSNFRDQGGRTVLGRLCSRLRRLAHSRELDVEISAGGDSVVFECAKAKDGDIGTIRQHARELVLWATSRAVALIGMTAVGRILRTVQTHLPWEERQLVIRAVYKDTEWEAVFHSDTELSKSDRIDLLRSTFLFHQFGDEELSRIASIVSSRSYRQGEDVVRQDDEGNEAYVIQEGRAEVLVEDQIGDTHSVAVLSPGDFFGELALLEDVPRSATVRAFSDLKVLVLDRPVFDRFVEHYGGAREMLAEAVRALRVIQKMPLFEEFSRGEVAAVATRFRVEKFDAHTNIVTQGETGDRFYVIQSGTVNVILNLGGKERKVVGTLGPGNYFGEIALLFNVRRTATVRSTEPVTAFTLNRADFLSLVGGNPFARQKLQREYERRAEVLRRAASSKGMT